MAKRLFAYSDEKLLSRINKDLIFMLQELELNAFKSNIAGSKNMRHSN